MARSFAGSESQSGGEPDGFFQSHGSDGWPRVHHSRRYQTSGAARPQASHCSKTRSRPRGHHARPGAARCIAGRRGTPVNIGAAELDDRHAVGGSPSEPGSRQPDSHNSGELIPASIEGQAVPFKRAGVPFANRFFFLQLVGLIWLVPGFADHRFAFAMMAWDVLVVFAWILDVATLPSPAQLKRS